MSDFVLDLLERLPPLVAGVALLLSSWALVIAAVVAIPDLVALIA